MWSRTTTAQVEEGECSPWDVHGGLARGSRGLGPRVQGLVPQVWELLKIL